MHLYPAGFIAKKRDGGQHSASDIHWFIESFQKGSVTDYQMTAWLMAVYLRGMSDPEMVALTSSMLHSGQVLKKPSSGRKRIDKHSTGGVGDKISLPLSAIAAACGLNVPMIAGRGLGHTGGTLDKLESISGYNVSITARRFSQIVERVGASIMGQTESIAKADRRIYALRDVTATVACRPLIVASILSKKLAEGLDGLVLDVKVGQGAFMTAAEDAKKLAQSLVQVATDLGCVSVARLSNMDSPLGRTIGNALEVKESVEILQGQGPSDSTELTLTLAEEMLLLGGLHTTRPSARKAALEAISSGEAWKRFIKMVKLHGGDTQQLLNLSLLPQAPYKVQILAESSGYLSRIETLSLAQLALALGAGRKTAEDKIDPAVGIEVHAKVGDPIAVGQTLATLHVRKKRTTQAAHANQAFVIQKRQQKPAPLLIGGPLFADKSSNRR